MIKFPSWNIVQLDRFLEQLQQLGWKRDSQARNNNLTVVYEVWFKPSSRVPGLGRSLIIEYVYNMGVVIR